MGAASSKTARGTARRYPKTPSNVTSPSAAPSTEPRPMHRKVQSNPPTSRPDAMDPDAMAGDFSQRLQQMGIVQPNPTYSPSSTAAPRSTARPSGPLSAPAGSWFPPPKANATLVALDARRKLQHEAEAEFDAMGSGNPQGRRFTDMRTLVEAMRLLNRGIGRRDVEKKLNLRTGLLDKMGRAGILSHEVAK